MAGARLTGIPIARNKQLTTLLFADDQVIISNTEDGLQKQHIN